MQAQGTAEQLTPHPACKAGGAPPPTLRLTRTTRPRSRLGALAYMPAVMGAAREQVGLGKLGIGVMPALHGAPGGQLPCRRNNRRLRSALPNMPPWRTLQLSLDLGCSTQLLLGGRHHVPQAALVQQSWGICGQRSGWRRVGRPGGGGGRWHNRGRHGASRWLGPLAGASGCWPRGRGQAGERV